MTDHRPSRSRGAHREPARRPRRARLLWLLAALAVATVAAVLLLRPGSELPPGTDARDGDSATWGELARWADAELPAGTSLLVTDDLLGDATAAGADERLRPLDADVAGARLLVTSEEPPPGSAVLARFGSPDTTALVVVDPAPGQPSAEELDRRRRLSAAVAANPNTGATGRAAEVLQRADVDARLLGLLALLVAQLDVGVADFPPAAGQPPDGVLARSVLLDRVGSEPVATGEAATGRLVAFLDAQLPPFAPQRVEVTEDGVLIGFSYESAPDALVTEQTP